MSSPALYATLRSVLLATALFGVLTGLGFWLWNPQPFVPPDRTRSTPALTGSTAAKPGTRVNLSEIIAANIFSPSRTAPRQRYNPAEYDGSGDPVPSPAMTGNPTTIQETLPQVSGIVSGPGGAFALMQEDSAGGPARLFREGDRIGAYRVVKIRAGSVIVSGPAGRAELTVERNQTGAK